MSWDGAETGLSLWDKYKRILVFWLPKEVICVHVAGYQREE